MNILIVEDEPTSRKLIHVVLAAESYTVCGVSDAETALEAIKQRKPELIVMDLALPGMSGLDLTRQLKKDPVTSKIPIVAITFYPSRFTRAEVLAAGCDAYFVKPVDTRGLPKAIAAVISKKISLKEEKDG